VPNHEKALPGPRNGKPAALRTGDNAVPITITAEDGVTEITYTVTVHRARTLPDDDGEDENEYDDSVTPVLSSLTVTGTRYNYGLGEEIVVGTLSVIGAYHEGSRARLNAATGTISTYDKTRTGFQTVTLTINGASGTFDITVLDLAALSRALIPVSGGTVPAGSVWGSSANYPLPQTIAGFRIGATEVSYDLWYEVRQWAIDDARGTNVYTISNKGKAGYSGTAGAAPAAGTRYQPVTTISWRDMVVWCNAYSEKEGLTPVYYTSTAYTTPVRTSASTVYPKSGVNGYRLPTRTQWEFAARGGRPRSAAWQYAYAGSDDLAAVGWYAGNSELYPQMIGTKAPNTLGIYDMSGNMAEFVEDSTTVALGGQINSAAPACTVSSTQGTGTSVGYGFRVAGPYQP
jgi:formylglycine-generating enzyme required for sulfatase activity